MGNKNIKLNTPALFILLGIWLYSLAAILLPDSIPYAAIFQGLFIFLVIAHAVECVIYRKILDNFREYLWVMFCGFLFIRTKNTHLAKMAKTA